MSMVVCIKCILGDILSDLCRRQQGFLNGFDVVLSLLPPAELPNVTGSMYPNEYELHWSILIIVYPYLTGLVAGAFILA
jgi:hypothetical protein